MNGITPLFTDLYELTMASVYYAHGLVQPATFSLFIRKKSPPPRNYYVAAGLEEALHFLAGLRFNTQDLAYLKTTELFSADFLDYLAGFRFSGDVVAMTEGTIFFPDEPLLEVTAPLIEAQIVETFLINTIGFQTMVATKAARCVQAAQGRTLVDFGLRRTHGQDAGLKAARCSYLVGYAASSNVLAGKMWQIPVAGTMAHSLVQAFADEQQSFAAFAETYPDNSIFLIDTYDTLAGARKAVQVAKQMKTEGHSLLGVRLDSGDIATLGREVRSIFNATGLEGVKIFASGGFDEFKIERIVADQAPIDAFGIGTKVGVSADDPYLDIVYKMVRYDGRDVRKVSPGKKALAGQKQVFRQSDASDQYVADTIGCRREQVETATTLLNSVMQRGQILAHSPPLAELRRQFQRNFNNLPQRYKTLIPLNGPVAYPVRISDELAALQQHIAQA